MTSEPADDRALAAISEGLQASAPELAHALDAFDRPHVHRWWGVVVLGMAGAVALVTALGVRGALIVCFAVVLAAPLCVAFVFCGAPAPVEELPPPAE